MWAGQFCLKIAVLNEICADCLKPDPLGYDGKVRLAEGKNLQGFVPCMRGCEEEELPRMNPC